MSSAPRMTAGQKLNADRHPDIRAIDSSADSSIPTKPSNHAVALTQVHLEDSPWP